MMRKMVGGVEAAHVWGGGLIGQGWAYHRYM